MTIQYLEYVRQQLIVATTDLSGATKGQLIAWLENARFDTKTYPRKKQRIRDEVTGKMITLNNPPIPGKQSLARGSSIALVQPIEYSTASWRRAVMSLDEHQKAWLLWNYSENIRWEYQETITCWAWEQFSNRIAGKRVAKKTMDRLRQLIWLASQDAKAVLAGLETTEHQVLARLTGICKSTWSETYAPYWVEMKRIYNQLDSQALLAASRSRSQQKAENYEQDIAKPN